VKKVIRHLGKNKQSWPDSFGNIYIYEMRALTMPNRVCLLPHSVTRESWPNTVQPHKASQVAIRVKSFLFGWA